MGRALKTSIYIVAIAVVAGLVAFAFYGNEKTQDMTVENGGSVDGAGKDENIDMSMLQSGRNTERDRRIERAMLEARYQADLAKMADAPEAEIERLKKRYRNDRDDMRARHEAAAEAEAKAKAAEEAATEESAEQD